VAVEVQDVPDDERRGALAWHGVARQPAANGREVGAPGRIEDDDLAVEQDRAAGEGIAQSGELGEGPGPIVAGARPQGPAVSVGTELAADAVELELQLPAVAGLGQARRAQHRRQESR
jgi:hypothetical protein